ncbi:hypothetical protein [Mycoplasma phocoeninasale]|uniref:Uncharacterized protein n=1 Tax=Mycoplasma phocoeninasale TaxID=2726117 RepID=A0A858U2L3_9MOLU|nr:hypothetical protein [Mycoplasma phocoeninasale]MBN0970700.1 hypothetical protein [Mycoplasma phocoeninasale]QJG66191.1 hypothetical protein HGG64_00440 [Mycoplasma phocoeninasale]
MINTLTLSPTLTLPIIIRSQNSFKRDITIFLSALIQIFFISFLLADIIIFSQPINLHLFVNYTISKILLICLGILLNFALINPLTDNIFLTTTQSNYESRQNNLLNYLLEKNRKKEKLSKFLVAHSWINIIWMALYITMAPIIFLLIRNFALDSTQNYLKAFSALTLIRLVVFDYIILPNVYNRADFGDNEVKCGNILNYLWINLTIISLYATFTVSSYFKLSLVPNIDIISLITMIVIPTFIFIILYITKVAAIYLMNRKKINGYVHISALLIWINKPE